ncbi:chromosome initiation inhibitor [Vibrio variabilis]|uniref:Chromosome initiation inhibitor n=1 Tax=Vibrio variabilis TaxID=990271 RepID=A0ABQ0JGN0_9VIBR|nr:chromosome initiation inhibitor [Vibrio variabilis]
MRGLDYKWIEALDAIVEQKASIKRRNTYISLNLPYLSV